MYFKRLEMQGFKSFVEPVVIDFHSGVTCVVGPNGSGKSNLSDAIRWVLGEQSAKSIRAGKMEDIIFSGTATRKPRGMAEVTLVIDNEEGILPIEYSEVSITRRLYRSGESEYLINNNPSRLKDIKELIMDTGIGVDGYSIISQGKITELVESKPEARREVFEEAAGVVLYKSKKQEAERKLETTNINLDRVNDIVNEIEGRIGGLREESIKAKEFIELRDRRKELEINITLRNVEKFTESNESGERDVRELENSIENVKFKKTNIDIKVGEKRDRFDNLDKLGTGARENLIKKIQEINEITSKSQVDDEKIQSFDRDITRLEGEIENINKKLTLEMEKSSNKEEAKDELGKSLFEADEKLSDAIKLYNEKTAKVIEVETSIQNSKNEMMNLSKDAVEKRADAKSYEQYKEGLINQKNKIIEEANAIALGKNNLTNALSKAENELSDIEEKIRISQNNQSDKRKEQNNILSDLQESKLKLEELKLKAGKIQARRKTIEEMESNYDGYNNAVRFLMKKDISGIYGVVAEHIKAPLGYEIAIETALGQTIQNVICQKDSDAKHAINILKENSAGRLTFLPIESVYGKSLNVNQAVTKARGYLGIASELVEYDKKIDGIIKYLLGRTIIVNDMDTAVSLSKIENSGFKFVTLDGEVINASGAITGGKYKNQTANILSRRNEIDKLKEEERASSNQVASLESDIINLNKLNEDITKDILDEVKVFNNLQIERANISSRIDNIKNSENESLENEKKRERELSNIENDYINADKLIEKSLREAENFEMSIKGIEAEISLNGLELESCKEEVATSNEEVTNRRIIKTKIEKEIENIDSILQVILDSIDTLTVSLDEKEEELESIKKKKATLMFGSNDSENDYNKLKEEKNEIESYILDIDKEKESIQIEIAELTKEQTSLLNQYNDMVDKKKDYEIKLAKNGTQLDILKQKLLDDFEITYNQALEFKKEDFVYSTAVKEARDIRLRMDELGDVNVGSIEEYEQVNTRYQFITEQREDILKAKGELEEIINNIDKTIRVKFKDNFDKVAINFEETFKELFGGGEAELTLVDSSNPLESGIDINVQPPGKKIQNIDAFSGGEKTMIGLALMMAVLKTKPTPFCILDEVEAALDDANIDKFAGSLRGFNDTQFTVITHQKATMEHADVLYGVTMPERGISKVLSLRLGDEFDLGD